MELELELTIATAIELELQTEPPVHIVPTGVLPVPPAAALPFYDNDEHAISEGELEYGDWYMLSENSDVGAHGTPKMVTLT